MTSREASPSRYGANRAGGIGSRRPPATPHLTERILRQSREAESALADALVSVHLHLRYLEMSVNIWLANFFTLKRSPEKQEGCCHNIAFHILPNLLL